MQSWITPDRLNKILFEELGTKIKRKELEEKLKIIEISLEQYNNSESNKNSVSTGVAKNKSSSIPNSVPPIPPSSSISNSGSSAASSSSSSSSSGSISGQTTNSGNNTAGSSSSGSSNNKNNVTNLRGPGSAVQPTGTGSIGDGSVAIFTYEVSTARYVNIVLLKMILDDLR